MEQELINKQKKRLFLGFLLSFAFLFTVLGIVVFQGINLNMYAATDDRLKETVENPATLNRELNFMKEDTFQEFPLMENQKEPEGEEPKDFQQIVLLRDKNGYILNEKALGLRYETLANLKFSSDNLGDITSFTTTDEKGNVHHFHGIATAKTSTANEDLAYLQVLVSTDQLEESMAHFKLILLISMLLAFLLAVILSRYLTNRALKPIVTSWKKQQEFVGNVSHELRTPLAVMQSQLEGLFLKPNETILEASEPIANSLGEIRRLTKMSNDLLLLARYDANELKSEKNWHKPEEFLAKIIEPYEELAHSQGKTLTVLNEIFEPVLFDQNQMQQVLIILLDNALKYTKENGKIEIISKAQDKYWQLSIKDNGIGLKEEQTTDLFERFYRGDKARTTKGTGLGLSIAKTIIDSHQGKIKAEKNSPKGAIFSWYIPRKN